MSNPVLPHYTLGATDAELRRLVDLASHEADRVAEAAVRANVGEGATVLDLGCGPLGALAAWAGVVGKRGRVVGVDGSAGALEKARVLLPVAEFPQVQLIQADVNELSAAQLDLGDGADAAYCRLMLMHQADPARTLRQMASLVRPGGVVIAHEASDLPAHAPASEPAVPAMTRVWELVIASARGRGANPDFARRGRAYLEHAGLAVESHRAYFVHYPPEIGYGIPRVALRSLQPVLAQLGLADEDEAAQLDRALAQATTRADVQWVSSPLMIEWIARKP